VIREAARLAEQASSPISDVRGSARADQGSPSHSSKPDLGRAAGQ